ncbi:hypothetical protein [Halovibrio sp. HP20-50]|uniref:hypothetical protein n=1 Tax=Halovibrio sp. HP20-59 TaxID=3080275 RepID=UPI00294AE3F6|nr:hypothetical protein [Halovibrio sp. HP20-59]MEA2117143.1 hypothetical protein [Halovibrio sp. HP20-59]
MDNPRVHIERNRKSQRPRWVTLCMMASVASVIVLAGCGDNEELPDAPADEAAPIEQDQDAANGQTSGIEQEPAIEIEQDPGLEGDSGSAGSMTQSTGAESETPMPEDTMDEPADGTMSPDDEPGFGEGTDPMPSDEESNDENGEDESVDDESTSS